MPPDEPEEYDPTKWRELTGKQFQTWVNSMDGPARMSKLIGYSIRSLERMYSGQQELPLAIKQIVRLSVENEELRHKYNSLRKQK